MKRIFFTLVYPDGKKEHKATIGWESAIPGFIKLLEGRHKAQVIIDKITNFENSVVSMILATRAIAYTEEYS